MNQYRLKLWQERLSKNMAAYEGELARMDRREEIYRGSAALESMTPGDRKRRTAHVRNLSSELIEAQVDSGIPKPKVTAKRPQDEEKARIIEDMLRNELDRLPFEQLNDMMERTVPIQGGGLFLVEWDSRKSTHTTSGELAVSLLHPKEVIPQDGVYTGIEDMDYLILRIPQTKEGIRRRYGVDVSQENEADPEVKAFGDDSAEDLVTQYTAYYRNDNGGIGRYSWVNDIELEDLEDYQARRLERCKACGELKPPLGEVCPKCGGKTFESREEEYEEVFFPIFRSDGTAIEPMPRMDLEVPQLPAPGAEGLLGEEGELRALPEDPAAFPVEELSARATKAEFPGEEDFSGIPSGLPQMGKIPYYKPEVFPVILQKNVSLYGKFLGDSDIDKISDQQNTANRIEAKIIDKILKSGSYLVLPDNADIRADGEDMKVIRPGDPAAAQMIGVKDMEGNISQDMGYLAQVYEEARQTIGVTDSFQGRRDTTATSGRAKEFSAAQAAGRLESKRVMKDAAYAALFEVMFKFKLAYADEARPVASRDLEGNTIYEEFNRYDFLEQDEAGEWYWNDQFLFSCDVTAPLASNRDAMWQETRQNLQSGAFGDPTDPETLILFWTKMEMLHYPGAGETKRFLEEKLQKQRETEQQAQMAGAQQGMNPDMGQQLPVGMDPVGMPGAQALMEAGGMEGAGMLSGASGMTPGI